MDNATLCACAMAPRECNNKNRKSGFTLLEIIAVLLIIAILASVAITRFVSLIADSQRMALMGGLAAGRSACSLAYGQLCLQNGTAPDRAGILGAVRRPVGADIIVRFEEGTAANDIAITASREGWTPTVSGTWTRP